MTDDGAETKTYDAHLIINWRDDDMRLRKTPPSGSAPHELVIPVSVDITVPEVQVPEIHANIEVPPAKVERTVTGGDAVNEVPDDV